MSRAYTPAEMRAQLIAHFRNLVSYWSSAPITDQLAKYIAERGVTEAVYRMEGLVFSILTVFDGESTLPAFDLYPPHPDDRSYLELLGENWYDEEVCVHDGSAMLHDEWHAEERARNEAKGRS